MQAINQFCGQNNGYSRSITLRNRLIPIGKTEENIQKFLESDKNRADKYPGAKQLIDNLHKEFIAEVLSQSAFDWAPLAEAIEKYQKTKDPKDKKGLEAIQAKLRTQIAKAFSSSEKGKKLFAKELFTELLPEYIKGKVDETSSEEIIKEFNRFTTYFTGFYDNRKNMYSAEEQATAISFRLVNENFPKFFANAKLYEEICEKHNEIITSASESLKTDNIASHFKINAFNLCLTQKGIDEYNQILGGIAADAGAKKVKGLNESINLYKQQHPDVKIGKMSMLYKQILSDREGSFIDTFDQDKDIFDAVLSLHEKILSQIPDIEKLYKGEGFDLNKIIVPEKKLTEFSLASTGKWSSIEEAIRQAFIVQNGDLKTKKDEEKLTKSQKKEQTLQDLNTLLDTYKLTLDEKTNIVKYLNIENLFKKTFESVEIQANSLEDAFNALMERISYKADSDLKQKDDDVEHIKNYLDCALSLYHYLELVDYRGESEKDSDFYSSYDKIIDQLSEILFLYNKIRNYVTKKIDTEKKFKLNFDCSSFMNGWATEFGTKDALLFSSDEKYYLGIVDNKLSKDELNVIKDNKDDNFYWLFVDFQKPDNKNTPRLFIRSKGTAFAPAVEKYNLPIKDVIDIYDKGLFKTEYRKVNEAIYKESLKKMIDYFKMGFTRHDSYKHYNFCWKESSKYNDISEFYNDVMNSCYAIHKIAINKSAIDSLVKNGKIYLFQIYNKDYAEKATGSKNLHTLYWENLFSDENLKDTVLKLSGGAELFFRPQVIKEDKIITHKKDSFLVNRIDKNGKRIPENLYQEIYQRANGIIDKISDEATAYENVAIIKKATHDIIKDRRFTQNIYQFHCPITMNFKAAEITGRKFNERVQEILAKDPTVKVIGIDRGERHLLYLSLINQKGEIELQKTLNLVDLNKNGQTVQVDYQQKLTLKEKERDNARKNWKTINNIKEIKEGYLSAVVHEIAKMMVEYNAIVVMEELNYGFKRGRFPVERQVYQKFELALIEKLNFLVFKNKNVSDAGGVLNAFQLTQKPDSLTDFGKQNGWLFYIPAAYTSKIDPKTGFANLFNLANMTNMDKKKEFFEQNFQGIRYDSATQSFVFSFTYSKDNASSVKSWDAYSRGERIKYNPKDKQSFKVNPTEDLKKIFDEKNIEWRSERNILQDVLGIPSEKSNAVFFDKLYQSFTSILQMRNSVANSTNPEDDYLISPIKSADGTFYDSRNYKATDKLPCDADANGAYHIALKGLYLLKNNFNKNDKGYIENISHADWFKFVQEKSF